MEAIVLAGGLGTRLAGRLNGVPKPMAPIAGRPFLEILLSQLSRAGCTRVILSVGHLHQVIRNHFADSFRGMRVDYIIEEVPLGTGGAIRMALAQAGEDSVLVLNGDTFLQADYTEMMRFHLTESEAQSTAPSAPMTMAIAYQADVARYGAVVVRDGHIVGFVEKGTAGPGWINAGAYILNRNLQWPAELPERFSFETDFLAPKIDRIAPAAYEVDGFFLDIGVPADLDRAQTALAGF
jgi:D-glycero-alpha-D-manno-heptose 1-phosphate guanylyltransferase